MWCEQSASNSLCKVNDDDDEEDWIEQGLTSHTKHIIGRIGDGFLPRDAAMLARSWES